MKTTTNKTTSQDVESTLQLNRPLLPIDKYVSREGLSKEIVEECGKLGLVQIRRHKGKTFVVDVPLGPYSCEREASADKTAQARKKSESTQESQNKSPLSQVRPGRVWRLVVFSSLALFFATIFACLWIYVDRKTQLDNLDRAYANIRTVYENYHQADQRADSLQESLNNSRAEVEHLQNELSNSRAQVKTIRNELTRARQSLEAVRQRNAEAAKWLDEQIRKLTARLTEPTTNR